MKIEITREKKWYSACLPKYRIVTQADSFEELIENINEALALYKQTDDKVEKINNLKEFSLVI